VSEHEKPLLQLLKLHFGSRKDGVWTVDAIFPLPLRSAEGAQNFFRIKDDPVVQQPTLLGTTSYFLGQSIVPLVAQVPGEPILRCLGTGFFISCSGLLVTAAHVISDLIEKQFGGIRELDDRSWHFGSLKIGVMIPLNPFLQGAGYIFRDIEWAAFLGERAERPIPIASVRLNLNSDAALCKVSPIAEGVPHQPLTIVQKGLVGTGLAVGKNAMAIGYGKMRSVDLTLQSERVVAGDFPFHLHASGGVILERFPDNLTERQALAPGPCFSAELQLPAGMSGSPIFDHEGIYVHGVVSTGFEDAIGVAKLGYGSMLATSLGVPIRPLGNKTLLQLFDCEDHGIPKLSGPGL
jgi:Trypsin-like peptidase domain